MFFSNQLYIGDGVKPWSVDSDPCFMLFLRTTKLSERKKEMKITDRIKKAATEENLAAYNAIVAADDNEVIFCADLLGINPFEDGLHEGFACFHWIYKMEERFEHMNLEIQKGHKIKSKEDWLKEELRFSRKDEAELNNFVMPKEKDYYNFLQELEAIEKRLWEEENITVHLSNESVDHENINAEYCEGGECWPEDYDFWERMISAACDQAGMEAENAGLDINKLIGRQIY